MSHSYGSNLKDDTPTKEELYAEAARLRASLAAAEERLRWRKTEEELPEDYQKVLAKKEYSDGTSRIFFAYRYANGLWAEWREGREGEPVGVPTLWLPIPEVESEAS